MTNGAISILLIEDNPADVQLLRAMLDEARTPPFALTVVSRLSDGIAALAKTRFDIVLLELSLPDSHGFDTFLSLFQYTADIPIIILTSIKDENLALQAVQSGAQDYLVKGEVSHYLLIRAVRYAIERQRMQHKLQNMSLLDDLTGIYNRRGFFMLAEQQLRIAYRGNRRVALMFADLDGLKQINDNYGHTEGDQALIQTAEIFRNTFRYSDIVARVGGDEFAILLLNAPHESLNTIQPRLQQNIAACNRQRDKDCLLSISYGIVYADAGNRCSLNELLTRADELMYAQKRSKGHRLHISA